MMVSAKTLILHNAKADLTIEVIPTSPSCFSGSWGIGDSRWNQQKTLNSKFKPRKQTCSSHQEPATAMRRLRQKLEDLTN